jgi:putative transposase
MQTVELSRAKEIQQDKDSLMLKSTSDTSLKPGLSAIAESLARSRKTTLQGKSSSCKVSSQKRKLYKTLAQESTSKEKDLTPFWNQQSKGISAQLSLPTETVLQDLDLNSLSLFSHKTVDKSWFSTKMYTVQNKSLPKICSPFLQSFPAGCTDLDLTVIKSKKIKLYLTAEQRKLVRQWEGTSRFCYNQTVALLKDGSIKSSWKSLKTALIDELPEWAKPVPYQIKSIAVRDACQATSNAKVKAKNTGTYNQVSFRRKTSPERSIYMPKSAIKPKGIYHTVLGEIRYAEEIPESVCDSRLILSNGYFYLAVSYKVTKRLSENQARIVALDPGVRTFITFFAENVFGKIGESDIGRIYRLCFWLDDAYSKLSKQKGRHKYRLKRAIGRMRAKIKNLVNELHHKSAKFLTDNFDIILLPKFETSQMVSRQRRKIRSKTARAMLNFSHYRFKQFLKHKALETGKAVMDITEEYTSKTVSWTGEVVEIGSAKKIKDKNGNRMDRDLNGARNILIKSLSDLTFREQISALGCSVNIC